jgi:hypothetical protein
MKWESPVGILSHCPDQEELIKQLVRGRWCRACPVSHYNTGNILSIQKRKPEGKKQVWPGWICRVIEGITTMTQEQHVLDMPSVLIYNEAVVYKPPMHLAYNHVHVYVSQQAADVDRNWSSLFRAMQHDLQYLAPDTFHFWCAANTKDKVIYIFIHEVIPHRPILYRDVNLLDRRDANAFLLAEEDMPVSQYPPVQTCMGSVDVLDTGGQHFVAAAQALAQQLRRNCSSSSEV